MHDERGYYYHAQAGNPNVRVYVRKGEKGIEFRLWQLDHPEVWQNHEWLTYEVILKAAQVYRAERSSGAAPWKIYDMAIARNLLSGEPE